MTKDYAFKIVSIFKEKPYQNSIALDVLGEALSTLVLGLVKDVEDITLVPEMVVEKSLDQEAKYMEAAVWMGTKGYKPYEEYGTGNVVQRAYQLGWCGPVLGKDKSKC